MDHELESMASVSAFPKKLYSIVSDTKNTGIVSWNSAGDQFIIHNPPEFCEKVLSKNDFSSTNYASFVRQLNMYDFHKIKSKVKDLSNTFYHKFFVRDRPSLLRYIKRKPSGVHQPSNAEQETIVKHEICESVQHNSAKVKKTQNPTVDKSQIIDKTLSLPTSTLKYEIIEDLKQKNRVMLNTLSSSKKINKSLLHSIYSSYLRLIKLSKKKQDDIEIKLNTLFKKNCRLINENNSILNEVNNKTEYSKSLEQLFYSIIDLLISKKSESSLGGTSSFSTNAFNFYGLFNKDNGFLDKLTKENMKKDFTCYNDTFNYGGLRQIGEETVKFNQSVTGSPTPFFQAESRILPETDSQLNDIFENDIKLSVNNSICVTPNIEAQDYVLANSNQIKDDEEIFIN